MEMTLTEKISERHVQAIWYDRELRPQVLRDLSGEEFTVVDPGVWNLGAGPDFKNAVIEVGPEHRRVQGDIEIHLNPSDWTSHGHTGDPLYRNVIAHITWNGGAPPEGLPESARSVAIGDEMRSAHGFSPSMVDVSAYPFARLPLPDRPCCEALKDRPDDAIAILRDAGKRRLRQKADRIEEIRRRRPGEDGQIFYEEIMNALGYKVNSRAFRQVAEAVPVGTLLAEPQIAADAMQTAARFCEWRYSGFRPNNSPSKRLLAAANMFTQTGVMALRNVREFSREDCKLAIKCLTDGKFIGRRRAAAILSNVIVPFSGKIPDWLPPEDISDVMRLTAFRMFGRDHNPAMYSGNNVLLQGLIQIYREFCLQIHPFCERCRLV